MSFTNPSFLWAMFAVSIPIIIHLINFRRHKTLYFSNTLFLENIKKETKTKTRLKHLLILIARILTIAALVFAFSGPFIPNKSINTDAQQAQINAIYLDNSFSMETESMKGIAFEHAKLIAKQLILNSPANMEYLFITNSMIPEHQALIDRDAILSYIDQASISSSSISINDVILKANTIIPKNEPARLYIISDMQKSFLDEISTKAENNIETIFVPIIAAKVNNLYIDTCYFETPIHKLSQQEILKAKIVNSSSEDFFDITVQLYINDSLKALSSFNIEASQSKEINIEYVNTVSGNIRGKLEISDYPITYDNDLYFNYKISEFTNILIINSGNENRYLTALFESDPENFKVSQVKAGNEQSASFETFDVIILNNFSTISSGLSSDLQNFAANGGSIIFIPASEIDNNTCNNFLSHFNAGKFEQGKFTNAKIHNIEYNHDLFKNVFQKYERQTDLPVMGLVHKYTLYSSSSFSKVLSIENETPVLIAGNYRNGKIYILSAPLTDINSEFVKSTLFVPAFFNIALNSQISNTIYSIIQNGAVAEINAIADISEYDILHLTNNTNIDAFATFRISGKTLQMQIPKDLTDAGYYNLIKGDNTFINYISLNYDRKESDLTYLNDEDLKQYVNVNFGDNVKIINANSDTITSELKEISEGRHLWQLFLLVAFMFILFEVALIKF